MNFQYRTKPQRQVTFGVPDEVIRECESKGTPIPPLPNADLIALHAACARVAYMSGAAEYFDMEERDAEQTTVLASDGSSSSLIHNVLDLVMVAPLLFFIAFWTLFQRVSPLRLRFRLGT